MDGRTSIVGCKRDLSLRRHIQNGSGPYSICKVGSFPGANRWKRENDHPYPCKRIKRPAFAALKHRVNTPAKTRGFKEVRAALVRILVATSCRLINTYRLPTFRRDAALSISILLCSSVYFPYLSDVNWRLRSSGTWPRVKGDRRRRLKTACWSHLQVSKRPMKFLPLKMRLTCYLETSVTNAPARRRHTPEERRRKRSTSDIP
jgi:hypothetical protein